MQNVPRVAALYLRLKSDCKEKNCKSAPFPGAGKIRDIGENQSKRLRDTAVCQQCEADAAEQ